MINIIVMAWVYFLFLISSEMRRESCLYIGTDINKIWHECVKGIEFNGNLYL